MNSAFRERSVLAHAAEEEFGVTGRFAQVAEDGFEGVADGEGGEVLADFDDLAELIRVVEAVVVAGSGLWDMNSGIDAALGEFQNERLVPLPPTRRLGSGPKGVLK